MRAPGLEYSWSGSNQGPALSEEFSDRRGESLGMKTLTLPSDDESSVDGEYWTNEHISNDRVRAAGWYYVRFIGKRGR